MKTIFVLSLAVFLAGCTTAPAPAPVAQTNGVGNIVRLDPAFDTLVPKDAVIEKVATGFQFTEGPLWRPDGHIWFSDVTGNVVRSVSTAGQVTVLIPNGGGVTNAPAGSFIGPNAMIDDKDGYVLLCQHTNRRIVRVAKDLTITPYLEKYEGKRFNSPNDLVYKSDGALYFTDPPYGLLKQDDDAAKELKFNAVYRYAGGKLTPLITDMNRPNGLAFSPDEKTFYVDNSDEKNRYWRKYDVQPDGALTNGKLFFDVNNVKEEGNPDGMKVDSLGNIYTSGPAGIWVFSPQGKHLGTINPGEIPANCAWGDDGKTLYITARTSVYRIKLAVAGEKALYQTFQ